MMIAFTLSTTVSWTAPNTHPVNTKMDRAPAQAVGQLPDQGKWSYLYDLAKTIDLNAPGMSLEMSSGGTSVYAVLVSDGKPLGGLIPENSATKVSGEIMTFNIARALGISDLYQPAAYHLLSGANLQKFKSFIPSTPFANNAKEENRNFVLGNIAKPALGKNGQPGIHAVFKEFGTKPDDYDALVSVSSNTLNTQHALPGSKTALAKLLTCKGPQPSRNTGISIKGPKGKVGTSTEYEMARQLSSIFLIDALSQQWDRFSGGNLQIAFDKSNGSVRFVSFDNGGTWGGTNWTKKFLGFVSRFDRSVAEEILAMDRFFSQGGSYKGLTNDREFANAMGIDIDVYPSAIKRFKESLVLVAAHIRANDGCYFE